MTESNFPDSIDAPRNAEMQRKAEQAAAPAPLAPPTDARHAELLAAFAAPELPRSPMRGSEPELFDFCRRLAREHMALLADIAAPAGATDQE